MTPASSVINRALIKARRSHFFMARLLRRSCVLFNADPSEPAHVGRCIVKQCAQDRQRLVAAAQQARSRSKTIVRTIETWGSPLLEARRFAVIEIAGVSASLGKTT